jgi:hypothetical protein
MAVRGAATMVDSEMNMLTSPKAGLWALVEMNRSRFLWGGFAAAICLPT